MDIVHDKSFPIEWPDKLIYLLESVGACETLRYEWRGNDAELGAIYFLEFKAQMGEISFYTCASQIFPIIPLIARNLRDGT